MRARGWVFTAGIAAGAVGGWMLAQRRLTIHQRDLFIASTTCSTCRGSTR